MADDPTGDAYLSPVDTAPATAWPRSASQKLPKKTIMVCGTVAIATLITGVAIVITGVAAGLPAHQMRPMPNVDCHYYYMAGYKSDGVHVIRPRGMTSDITAYCEMTGGVGWTRIQRRIEYQKEFMTTSLDFNRNWSDFKTGFGDPLGEHWLGNDVIHAMTNQEPTVMRWDLILASDSHGRWAEWDQFSIESEADGYRLYLAGHSGTTSHSFAKEHSGWKWSTNDVDNDAWGGGSCARKYFSGWWHKLCAFDNLNNRFRVAVNFSWQNNNYINECPYENVQQCESRPSYPIIATTMKITRAASLAAARTTTILPVTESGDWPD